MTLEAQWLRLGHPASAIQKRRNVHQKRSLEKTQRASKEALSGVDRRVSVGGGPGSAGLAAGPASRLPFVAANAYVPAQVPRGTDAGVARTFYCAQRWNAWRIEDGHHTEKKLQALIKIEVACRLALESLPELPRETQQALRAPIEKLCELTDRALDRLQPGFARDAEST